MDSGNQDIYLPEHLTIIREPDSIMIRRRWFSGRYAIAAIFLTVILVGFAPPYVKAMLQQGIWAFLLLLVPWVAYVTYYWLAKLVNSSFIYVNKDIVDIRHKPFPIPSRVRIATNTISRVQLEQKRYNGRSRQKYFELSAFTKDNRKQKLLSDIDFEIQAIYIKKEIEKFLTR